MIYSKVAQDICAQTEVQPSTPEGRPTDLSAHNIPLPWTFLKVPLAEEMRRIQQNSLYSLYALLAATSYWLYWIAWVSASQLSMTM